MQRAEQLRPLSRQHHLGLTLGLKASQLPDDTIDSVIKEHWQQLEAYIHDELTAHFGVEETYLINPLLQNHRDNAEVKALGDTLLAQHQALDTLSQTQSPTLNDLRQLGQQLYDHIRFEEREVFPLAQKLLTPEELETIYQQTDKHVK